MIDAIKDATYLIDAWERGANADEYVMEISALHQAIAEAEKEAALQEITDIGQWDTSDMAHRAGGLSVEQAPVAWIYNGNLHAFDPTDWAAEPKNIQPLYLAPPKREQESVGCDCIQGQVCHICDPILPAWVSLTDEEIADALGSPWLSDCAREVYFEFARAIEQRLKEKNT